MVGPKQQCLVVRYGLQAQYVGSKRGRRLWLKYRKPNVAKLDQRASRQCCSCVHGINARFPDGLGSEAAIWCRMMLRHTPRRRANRSGSFSSSILTEKPRTTLKVSARTSLASCCGIPDDTNVSSHAASTENRVCRVDCCVSCLSRCVLSSLIAIASSIKK